MFEFVPQKLLFVIYNHCPSWHYFVLFHKSLHYYSEEFSEEFNRSMVVGSHLKNYYTTLNGFISVSWIYLCSVIHSQKIESIVRRKYGLLKLIFSLYYVSDISGYFEVLYDKRLFSDLYQCDDYSSWCADRRQKLKEVFKN